MYIRAVSALLRARAAHRAYARDAAGGRARGGAGWRRDSNPAKLYIETKKAPSAIKNVVV